MNEINKLRRELAAEKRKHEVIELKEEIKFWQHKNNPVRRQLSKIKQEFQDSWRFFWSTMPKP